MGHENNSLGSVLNGIFDCWDSSGDTLRVRNFLIRVEGDVEVDLDVSMDSQYCWWSSIVSAGLEGLSSL